MYKSFFCHKLTAKVYLGLLFVLLSIFANKAVYATSITIVPSSPFIGPTITKPTYTSPQGDARPFDTSQNLAFQGGISAQAAVSSSTIPGFPDIHLPEFVNDGFYGNGSSWIGSGENNWLKIDLGQITSIDRIMFGRDRLGDYDGRDPGQCTIAVATAENFYVNGDATNDSFEYTEIVDSASLGFSGLINGSDTIQVSFDAVLTQYVKLTFANSGVAIDEVEIFGAVPEPATIALLGIGLAGLAGTAVRRRRMLKMKTSDKS